MFVPPRYAIIPTHNRPIDLASLVQSLGKQCDQIIVIDNASPKPVSEVALNSLTGVQARVTVVRDDEQPPNLSRLWNIGLELVADLSEVFDDTEWDVAILNDDTVLPHGWFDYVSWGLRRANHAYAPAVCCGALAPGAVGEAMLKREPDRDLMTRMTPHAFVTRGELGLRADEQLRWWWQDTDFDWRARQAGGVLILPGYVAVNSKANSTTFGALAEQAGRDRETFRQKWGNNPW